MIYFQVSYLICYEMFWDYIKYKNIINFLLKLIKVNKRVLSILSYLFFIIYSQNYLILIFFYSLLHYL